MSESMTFKLAEHGRSFLTRDQAALLRRDLETHLRSGRDITVDLMKVTTITPSFADELLGRLLLVLGPTEFRKRITLVSESSETRRLLNKVLSHRMKEY